MYRPTIDETSAALVACLPAGEAWQSGDVVLGYDKTILRGLVRAIASEFNRVEQAIADLFAELFVSTAAADLDLWREEYGLPDDCDPWGNNVVTKATAFGGTSANYYADIARALGYDAKLVWNRGPSTFSTLHVVIIAATSRPVTSQIALGNWRLGETPLGAADLTRLVCALAEVVHAHVAITYEIV